MQVSNTSDQSTRYTVSSGTIPPVTPPPGTLLQGILEPGEQHEVHPRGDGPWKVMFMPEGNDRVVATARNRGDCVNLRKDEEGFCCEVQVFRPLDDNREDGSGNSTACS